MTKLNSLVDTYLYISRNIDTEILRYLNETEQAVSFYYSIENSQTDQGYFLIIYIIVVTLLLFLSTSIAMFASRLTKPIVFISASDSISRGVLDVKVPELETDEEFKQLNKNFNLMIERLKEQQDKLLITERYEPETVARKLAHEIKSINSNPIIYRYLRGKYKEKLVKEGKDLKVPSNYQQANRI